MSAVETYVTAIHKGILTGFAGAVLGGAVEYLTPVHAHGKDVTDIAIASMMALALNGVSVALASSVLRGRDPTGGMVFALGLLASQPHLQKQLRELGRYVPNMLESGEAQN